MGVALPNFAQDFQRFVKDGSLIPGWHKQGHFHHSLGRASHVSVSNLTSLVPPGSSNKALKLTGPDLSIWNASYREEFEGLHNNDCFEIISEEEYPQFYHSTGKCGLCSHNCI